MKHDALLPTGYSLTLNNIDTLEPYTGVPNGNISDTGSIILDLNHERSYADSLFGELSFTISGASNVEIMVTLQDGTDKTATVRNDYKTKILKCNLSIRNNVQISLKLVYQFFHHHFNFNKKLDFDIMTDIFSRSWLTLTDPLTAHFHSM